MEKEEEDKEAKERENIIVSYAKNGKSFESIVEDIILRKLDEI